MSSTPAAAHWEEETDVVVLGLGAAGCAAAISAHDSGARVVVLEKMPEGLDGGNTRISGGAWFDNRDPESGATYLRALCGEFTLPEAIVDAWSRETAANAAWVESLGARVAHHGEYLPEYPELPGSSAYGGYFGVNGEMGQGLLFGVLQDAVKKRGIRVLRDCPGRELLRDTPGGRICGVRAEAQGNALRVAARQGVILATGSFENNPEMVRDYLRLGDCSIWGSAASTGDGIKMAQQVGADLWHMDNMAAYTGLRVPGFSSAFYVAFDDAQSFIYLGMDGTRIVNERPQTGHGQALLHGSYQLFPAQKMHVLFDDATRRTGPISPGADRLPVGWNVLMEGYAWSEDNSREIEKGWLHRGDTPAALAPMLGVDAEALEETVRRYNQACERGVDEAFGRSAETLVALREPPFYAFTSAPMLGWTNGGPRRDEHARVLDPFGIPISGLYAAGCVSSTYSWCKDGGFHIADALAFGRIAGRHAAAETGTAT